MNNTKSQQAVYKEPILENLQDERTSALKKYQGFFIGSYGWGTLLKYELLTAMLGPMPGAAGYLLRKLFYPHLFKQVGAGVNWGRSISVRHPGKIIMGNNVAIDEYCLLDAKGGGDRGIQIGSDVMISRSTIIQAKTSWVKIDDRCTIGSHCSLSSSGGIQIGKDVLIASHCSIGGGRYRFDDKDKPIRKQGTYTYGPTLIEDDVWLGAGVIVQDGIHIGRGCVVGSGAVVNRDIPPYSVAVGVPARVISQRGEVGV